ncbi:C2 domain-containing protein [Melia azedarach]|uniref:C2 domain-containing protein n=1 Tax=Melia azedarach TaxID=155640 RepID=A0ACC1YSM8_MELAZ|nr:C2 domain-containing protein [Melia azedarach]
MTTAVNPSLMASSNPLDLEITIICAKHLKNVNWRNGDLKPYVVFYLDPDYRLATHADESGSTRPVWNERFTLPVTRPVRESILTFEIFHSKVSETPKPLVGSVKFPLAHLVDSDDSTQSVRKIELLRPSGRPQGKIRVKLVLKERPLPPPSQDYQATPEYSNYYYSAPPPPFPPPSRDYTYYSGYYSAQPPAPPRPLYSRASNHSFPSGSVPSAPVDFSPSQDYKQPPVPPPRAGYGVPSGSGPSAPVDYSPYDQKLQKQFGGLSLDEEVNKKQREKRAESEFAARDNYSYNEYRHDY